MEVFSFHLMPYAYLPDDYEGSAWITVPNALYDPVKGQALYHRYLDELEAAEPLGFDGVVVNEHHQNAYGLMPSPNLFAAMLARRTERVKIAVVGNALPLYNPPTRVAEEYAILDVVTGGRLIAGMVVGGGPEYFSFGINPTEARRRYAEALDLIIAAWTTPGPFEFHGEFFHLRYVNPWPRPLQQPHPPIWVPGVGSLETMEMVADRGFGYCGLPYFHMDVFERNYRLFRETWLGAGRDADPMSLSWFAPIYVADTDEQARAEYEEHFWYFARRLLDGVQASPPGYTTARSAKHLSQAIGQFLLAARTWDDVVEGGYAIVGSPATVTQRLVDHMGALGAGRLLGLFQVGSLPHDLTMKNLGLFAEQVMPALRKEFPTGPAWAEAA
ncbi:MAG TPA: LLM class flavin-dependent oxidoreductase [Acidimicrobiia bacterium]|nr:LLM class flavin-dependent oxidoreductase [Acidimicrobiia bacterium]